MSWAVANISGSVGQIWRVAKLGGSVVAGVIVPWRVLNLSGTVGGSWRVAKISGTSTAATVPVLGSIATGATDPVQKVTLMAVSTNGIVPDSYSFVSAGITFTVTGNTATFLAPGSPTGGTVAVTVTATKNGQTSSPVTANVIINPAGVYYLAADGSTHAVSYPYQQT